MEPQEDAKIPKTERLLNLVAYLLRTRVPVHFETIREQVVGYTDRAPAKVLIRRFERDKHELRGLGVPIEYDPEHGYSIPKDRYFLAPFELSAEDALLIRALARLAEGGPLPAEEVRAAVRKLALDREAPSEAAPEAAGELIVMSAGQDASFPERFLQLAEAVGGRRAVTFSYRGEGRRRVEPYGLGFAAGAWRVVGRCEDSVALRVYRVDRIAGKIAVDEEGRFEVPAGFDIEPFLNRQSWEDGPGEASTVEVELEPPHARQAAQNLGDSARFEELPDGGGRLTLAVRDHDALLPWLLEQLPHVRRVEPAALRAQLRDVLDRVEAAYE